MEIINTVDLVQLKNNYLSFSVPKIEARYSAIDFFGAKAKS